MIAVVRPAAALMPVVTAKPSANGSATIATVSPATKSLLKSDRLAGKSFLDK